MVKIMENPNKMDDLGAHPYFWKHPNNGFHMFPYANLQSFPNAQWMILQAPN